MFTVLSKIHINFLVFLEAAGLIYSRYNPETLYFWIIIETRSFVFEVVSLHKQMFSEIRFLALNYDPTCCIIHDLAGKHVFKLLSTN